MNLEDFVARDLGVWRVMVIHNCRKAKLILQKMDFAVCNRKN